MGNDFYQKQGLRYLLASIQDGHPIFGLTHASYARIFFERVQPPNEKLLKLAAMLQEKWGKVIESRFPFESLF